jgi:hypothetical protein
MNEFIQMGFWCSKIAGHPRFCWGPNLSAGRWLLPSRGHWRTRRRSSQRSTEFFTPDVFLLVTLIIINLLEAQTQSSEDNPRWRSVAIGTAFFRRNPPQTCFFTSLLKKRTFRSGPTDLDLYRSYWENFRHELAFDTYESWQSVHTSTLRSSADRPWLTRGLQIPISPGLPWIRQAEPVSQSLKTRSFKILGPRGHQAQDHHKRDWSSSRHCSWRSLAKTAATIWILIRLRTPVVWYDRSTQTNHKMSLYLLSAPRNYPCFIGFRPLSARFRWIGVRYSGSRDSLWRVCNPEINLEPVTTQEVAPAPHYKLEFSWNHHAQKNSIL